MLSEAASQDVSCADVEIRTVDIYDLAKVVVGALEADSGDNVEVRSDGG